MDCSEIRELLSNYFDDELTAEGRTAVTEHLVICGDCSAELARFENLSALAARLDTPTPPAQTWTLLECELERTQVGKAAQPARHNLRSWLPMPRLVALAATILAVVSLGWFGYANWSGHGEHDAFAVEFAQYLEKRGHDPAAAHEYLLAKYEGKAVDAQEAVHLVGYRPAVAGGLPEGYAFESTHVMKMPCCTCVHCLCKRSDGGMIAIFEHDEQEATQWFGDRTTLSATCNGKQCILIDVDDGIAATWQRGDRHITAVGVRDLTELTRLVAWFDKPDETRLLQ